MDNKPVHRKLSGNPMQLHSDFAKATFRSLGLQTPAGSTAMMGNQRPMGSYKALNTRMSGANLRHSPYRRIEFKTPQPIQQVCFPVEKQQPLTSTFEVNSKPTPIDESFIVPYFPINMQDYGLNPYSYGFTDYGAEEFMGKLTLILVKLKIDHEFKKSKSKCKCVYYKNGKSIKFNIRMFQLTPAEYVENGNKGHFVVEIEKKNPSVVEIWSELLTNVLGKLVQDGILETDFTIAEAESSIPKPSFGLMQPPKMERQVSAVADQEQSLKQMLELAQSPYTSVKQQASEILSVLSQNVDSAKLLGRLEAVKTLCESVDVQNESDWSRSAVSTIANICSTGEFESNDDMVNTLDVVIQLFLALSKTDCYLKREIRRESVRAIEHLTKDKNFATRVAGNQAVLAEIKNCCNHSDVRLADHALNTLRNVSC